MVKSGDVVYIYCEELETQSGKKFNVYRIKDGKEIRRLHFAKGLTLPHDSGRYKLTDCKPYSSELPFGVYVKALEKVD